MPLTKITATPPKPLGDITNAPDEADLPIERPPHHKECNRCFADTNPEARCVICNKDPTSIATRCVWPLIDYSEDKDVPESPDLAPRDEAAQQATPKEEAAAPLEVEGEALGKDEAEDTGKGEAEAKCAKSFCDVISTAIKSTAAGVDASKKHLLVKCVTPVLVDWEFSPGVQILSRGDLCGHEVRSGRTAFDKHINGCCMTAKLIPFTKALYTAAVAGAAGFYINTVAGACGEQETVRVVQCEIDFAKWTVDSAWVAELRAIAANVHVRKIFGKGDLVANSVLVLLHAIKKEAPKLIVDAMSKEESKGGVLKSDSGAALKKKFLELATAEGTFVPSILRNKEARLALCSETLIVHAEQLESLEGRLEELQIQYGNLSETVLEQAGQNKLTTAETQAKFKAALGKLDQKVARKLSKLEAKARDELNRELVKIRGGVQATFAAAIAASEARMRAEWRAEMGEVRAELTAKLEAGLAQAKAEMAAQKKHTSGTTNWLFHKLVEQLGTLRAEMDATLATPEQLRAKIDELAAKLDSLAEDMPSAQQEQLRAEMAEMAAKFKAENDKMTEEVAVVSATAAEGIGMAMAANSKASTVAATVAADKEELATDKKEQAKALKKLTVGVKMALSLAEDADNQVVVLKEDVNKLKVAALLPERIARVRASNALHGRWEAAAKRSDELGAPVHPTGAASVPAEAAPAK